MRKALTLLALLVTTFVSPLFGGETAWVERIPTSNVQVSKSEKSLEEPERVGFMSAPKKPASGFKKAIRPTSVPNWLPIGTNNTPQKVVEYRLSRINGISVGFDVDNGSGGWESRSGWGIDALFEEGTTFSNIEELETSRTAYFNLYKDAVRSAIEKEPGYAGKQWRFVCLFTEDHYFEGEPFTGTQHFEQWTLFVPQDGKVPSSVSEAPIKEAAQLYIYMGDNAQYIYNRNDVIGQPGVRHSSSVSTYDEVSSINQFLAPWYRPTKDIIYGRGEIDLGNGQKLPYQPTGWIVIYHYRPDGSYEFAKYRKENGERVLMDRPVLKQRPKDPNQNFVLFDLVTEEKVIADIVYKTEEVSGQYKHLEGFLTEYGTNTVLRAFTVSAQRTYGVSQEEAPGLLPTTQD